MGPRFLGSPSPGGRGGSPPRPWGWSPCLGNNSYWSTADVSRIVLINQSAVLTLRHAGTVCIHGSNFEGPRVPQSWSPYSNGLVACELFHSARRYGGIFHKQMLKQKLSRPRSAVPMRRRRIIYSRRHCRLGRSPSVFCKPVTHVLWTEAGRKYDIILRTLMLHSFVSIILRSPEECVRTYFSIECSQ